MYCIILHRWNNCKCEVCIVYRIRKLRRNQLQLIANLHKSIASYFMPNSIFYSYNYLKLWRKSIPCPTFFYSNLHHVFISMDTWWKSAPSNQLIKRGWKWLPKDKQNNTQQITPICGKGKEIMWKWLVKDDKKKHTHNQHIIPICRKGK